ncbi:MAG: sigma-70 family RNA polymerase sigma factor [Desulfobacterales bacterium]|nr:sigma-70 family RNA polymerase sigma factor [Desulfobacterales bacterium]
MVKKTTTEKAYKEAQKRWPGVHVDFGQFRKRVEAADAKPEKMALEDLYLAVALGNESNEALKLFYDEYSNYIQQISMKLAKKKEFAEDIMHEFILELPNKIMKYNGTASLKGWLRMVVYSFSIDCLRKIKHFDSSDCIADEVAESYYDQLDIEYCNKLFNEILPKAMEVLKDDWQLMIQCKFYDGLTNREIAATVLKTNEYNISKWLKKAFIKMRKRLINLAAETGPDGKENLFECLKLFGKLFDI